MEQDYLEIIQLLSPPFKFADQPSEHEAMDIQDHLGDTALHTAAKKGHVECVLLLLNCNINTYIVNNDNETALQCVRRIYNTFDHEQGPESKKRKL